MPYIPPEARAELSTRLPETAGELNYMITSSIHVYLQTFGVSYNTINQVIGVLECAKLEAYRKLASPYEDKKHGLNGSVSNLDA